jgi:hypothetical protein
MFECAPCHYEESGEFFLMRRTPERKVRAEASRGKNEPLARNAKVIPEQNGEVRPTRQAARQQPGTDQANRSSPAP